MTFEELLRAVDQLNEEERQHLRQYLDEAPKYPTLPPEERIRLMDEAVAIIREGMTQVELDEMTTAMNEEYIEPWDESEWID